LVTSIREKAPKGIRLPAVELEKIVISSLRDWLLDTENLIKIVNLQSDQIQTMQEHAHDLANQLQQPHPSKLIKTILHQVTIHPDSLDLDIRLQKIFHLQKEELFTLKIPTKITRCGSTLRLLIHGNQGTNTADPKLISHLSKAHDWLNQIITAKVPSIQALASKEKVSASYVSKVIDCALLAPEIVRAIMNGSQPAELNLEKLRRLTPLPIDWDEQRKYLGFTSNGKSWTGKDVG